MSDVQATSEPVFEFDSLMQPDFSKCPQPYYKRMRDTNPILRMGEGEASAVFVALRDDIDNVLHDTRLFSSKPSAAMTRRQNQPLIPISMDPPEHSKWRRLLDPFFSPRVVRTMEDEVTRRANELIDRFIERGECDYATEYAVPLPCSVFIRLMGLPIEELDAFVLLNNQIMRGSGEGFMAQDDVQRRAFEEVNERLGKIIDERRRHPQDDLVTKLIQAEFDGRPLSHGELMGVCHLLFVAGLDTVTDSLTCFYAFLGRHPEHHRRLVDDPEVIPRAIEEMLRYETPVTMVLPRVVTEDTELNGCPLKAGEQLILLLGSANTDERFFERADVVDFDRSANRHYGFGGGVHRCLGSHLARLELRVSLQEWHRRIPEYHIPDDVELEYAPLLRQVEHLPIVFDRVQG